MSITTTTEELPTGMLADETSEFYHSAEAWSKSKLDDFRELPLLAHGRYVAKTIPRKPETEALRTGRQAHALILEGAEAYGAAFAVVPADAPKRPTKTQLEAAKRSAETKATIEWWKTFDGLNAGKTYIDHDDHAMNRRLNAAVWAQPTAALLLERGVPEVTFRVRTPRYYLQCRPDWWAEQGASAELVAALRAQGIAMDEGEPYVCDLKTVPSLSDIAYRNFAKNFAVFGYHRQGPFYTGVMRDVLQRFVTKFFYIVVEKQEPFSCAVFLADDKANEVGWAEVSRDLQRLNLCYDSGVWPGVPLNVQSVGLPSWYLKKHDSEDEGGES